MKISCKTYGYHNGSLWQWVKALAICRGEHEWFVSRGLTSPDWWSNKRAELRRMSLGMIEKAGRA